jgi:DNA-binding SARP family transcriptional activator
LINAPAGYVPTDTLAATLLEAGRPVVWLSLGAEDEDPATLLISLISAARRLRPEVGASTFAQMRARPGPVYGWPALFAGLAREFSALLPGDSAIVLEGVEHLSHTPQTLQALHNHYLTQMPVSMAHILLSERPLPIQIDTIGVEALRITTPETMMESATLPSHLPLSSLRRAIALTQGRIVALSGLLDTETRLGGGFVQKAIDTARSLNDLFTQLVQRWQAGLDVESRQDLAFATRLGCYHPNIVRDIIHRVEPVQYPWLQNLAGGWLRVRPIWLPALQATANPKSGLSRDMWRHIADSYASNGEKWQAVQMLFQLHDDAKAAGLIAELAPDMLNLGQWQLLDTWLRALSPAVLSAWPWLLYTRAELLVVQGHTEEAQRGFSAATHLFRASQDFEGVCQTLLAESAIALRQGDLPRARVLTLEANSVAEQGASVWHRCWTTWQLGCLDGIAGQWEDALAWFNQAASAAHVIGHAAITRVITLSENVVRCEIELCREREYHHSAYLAAEQAAHEGANQLRQWVTAPLNDLDALLTDQGWSRLPLPLKLSSVEMPALPPRKQLWQAVLQALSLFSSARIPTPLPFHASTPFEGKPGDVGFTAGALPEYERVVPLNGTQPNQPVALPAAPHSPSALSEKGAPDRAPSDTEPALAAYMLGPFRVLLNGRAIENWPSGRGRAVLEYLLSHHETTTPRDVLMETFWPETSQDAARNNLNVALHGLRRALGAIADVPVVVYRSGAYHISADLHVWLDVDEYDQRVQSGQRLEVEGKTAEACREYEAAISLYQGDFLADAPYDEWPVFTRERLRVSYLDTLDRLSRIYFDQDKYAICATLCQLLLSRDNCREDAHCRLMRCYCRQGQYPLAVRQYQLCIANLRSELNVAPSEATTQLYEQVKSRRQV